jgi:hypothetical protein
MKWLRLIDTFLQHGLTGPGASAAWQAFRQQPSSWGATAGMPYGWRSHRKVRPFRPFRWLFSLFWTLFWVFFGLSMAFVPEFRHFIIRLPMVLVHWLRDFWSLFLPA